MPRLTPTRSRPRQPKATLHHYAIIGRIPDDDEDSCYFYEAASSDAAVALFEQEIYEDRFAPTADLAKAAIERNNGAAVFINHILKSGSPFAYENRAT